MEKDATEKLMAALSNMAGRTLSTSSDYEYLSDTIRRRTGEYISATTLKRLGGYLSEKVATRRATLDILARALGYRDMEDFEKIGHTGIADSNPSGGMVIESTKLSPGFIVQLAWQPNRRCVLRYSGNNVWEVVESEHTRLKPGQKMECHYIIDKEPLEVLLLSDSENPENLSGAYVCGRTHGIAIINYRI